MSRPFVHATNRRLNVMIEGRDSVPSPLFVPEVMGFQLGNVSGRERQNFVAGRLVCAGVFRDTTIEYFPNSNPLVPVPAILTDAGAIHFLRLDEEDRDHGSARRSFRRLLETKQIRPARIGLRNRFLRDELLRFARHATELAGQAPNP